MRMAKSSSMTIPMVPPGIVTVIARSQAPILYAAAALLLVPEASL
jgi:hypothetical protein